MFIRFDMIHERDRRTDVQTDGHRMAAIAALMHSIARQKSRLLTNISLFLGNDVRQSHSSMADQQKVVYGLSNGAIFSDLERPYPRFQGHAIF